MTQEYHRFKPSEWDSIEDPIQSCIIDRPKLEVYMGQRVCQYGVDELCPFKHYSPGFRVSYCERYKYDVSWVLKEDEER